MENDIFIKQLGSSIQSWLSYISSVGRSFVLGESSIKLPLAEFIGTKIADADAVKLEYLHPNLFMKRMDLYYKKMNDTNEYQTAFEFKYIKDASTLDDTEKQRIFNDLMRLFVFVNEATVESKGYFLICGSQYEFDISFQKIIPTKKHFGPRRFKATKIPNSYGFYKKWFSFDLSDPVKSINPNVTNRIHSKYYAKFFSDYNEPYNRSMGKDLPKPKEIFTKLIFLSQDNNLKEVPLSMKLGIWEILVK